MSVLWTLTRQLVARVARTAGAQKNGMLPDGSAGILPAVVRASCLHHWDTLKRGDSKNRAPQGHDVTQRLALGEDKKGPKSRRDDPENLKTSISIRALGAQQLERQRPRAEAPRSWKLETWKWKPCLREATKLEATKLESSDTAVPQGRQTIAPDISPGEASTRETESRRDGTLSREDLK